MAAIVDPDVPGFFAPVHRALTDPILMGGAPRTVAIANGTLGGGDRARPPALDPRRAHLGSRPCRRRLGGETRPAVRRRGAPAPSLPRIFRRVRRHAEPCRISPSPRRPRRLPALGGAGRRGVVLNKDGSFQRTARFRGPDLDSATPAELVGVTARLNNALRRLGSGWAIFVEAQRHAAQTYPHCDVSRSGIGPGRSRAAGRLRGGRRAFREPLFPDLRLAAAGRGRLTGRGLALRGPRRRPASIPGSCCTASSTAPTASCNWSRASCPRSAGSMTATR